MADKLKIDTEDQIEHELFRFKSSKCVQCP